MLDLRFCDLGLTLTGTWVEACIERLYGELDQRGILLHPHVWLSEEWFSPDGIPGIAVPFYLAHPRLMRLERRMMLEVEGGTRDKCMKLLRHETGHAVQHAFEVHRRRRWQRLFGINSKPYPEFYWPRPGSRRFVQHLDAWYAQSHPSEDFAETFAVWLPPHARWRSRYAGWPALAKLDYVDALMGELAGQRPRIRRRAEPDKLRHLDMTLRKHYAEKRARYAAGFSEAYDAALLELFRGASTAPRAESAAAFLRRYRREIRDTVCHWSGEYAFTVDQVINEMMLRCQELDLRATGARTALKLNVTVFLTTQTMHYLYRGGGWHAV